MSNIGIEISILGNPVSIDFTGKDGRHIWGLWDQPFQAIKKGTKKVEARANVAHIPFDYSIVKQGDEIEFVNELNNERLFAKVKRVSHYNSSKELYINEGLSISSSNPKSIAEGISNLEKHTGYKEAIKNNGIFAFELELIED
jgi:ASC-1-like (ASCH) protein